MGFLDTNELEEKTQSMDMQNRELEEQLAALEEEGAHLAATLREVREKAQELNDSLVNSLSDNDLLQQELQAEQFARAELQERVEATELEIQDVEARPRFVVFPVNRGTLGRGSHAAPQTRVTPPVIRTKLSTPVKAIGQPPVAGLLEAPPAASHVSYIVQAPPAMSLPVIGGCGGGIGSCSESRTVVLGSPGGWSARPSPVTQYTYAPAPPVGYLAQPMQAHYSPPHSVSHQFYSPAHSVSRQFYSPAHSVSRPYYNPAHSITRQYHVVG